ncbi:MAG: exodeoxyribonuclease VII small subunit [Peptoniphilus sp.]|nr:exodeoxyribonuclease VII small subunit [Peptoniphilus sp.]MDD7362913.1 exodeoxyribonuclease VII small subunit [Bacillota bacterium]MDY6044153.1 exodeoxyribonuclease VII small subunit [Peptoniphilus sp.]
MNYREKSDKLEAIVQKMENEDLTLEEMVELYEEGTALYKSLEKDLTALEQKVRILTKDMEDEEEDDEDI